MILVLRVTVHFVLQAHEEADLLRGGGSGETVPLLLLLLVGGRGGLGLGDLPVAAVEIQGGESRRVVHLGDGSTLALQVQGGRAQAFTQTGVTESKKKERKLLIIKITKV